MMVVMILGLVWMLLGIKTIIMKAREEDVLDPYCSE
jgi:hypothetical protein